MRLIGYNYSQLPETYVSASSSNPNFPVSNIKHQHRSKQWRSNSAGTFVVGVKNKIDFVEVDGGSVLTATVPSGTYTAKTLESQIKNQMETAGTNDYSVSFSETSGQWTVTSNGPYLEILNATGPNSSNALFVDLLGFLSEDCVDDTSYTGTQIAIHSYEAITMDLRTTEPIDSVVILWPKEDGIKLSDDAVIRVQANATDVWNSPAVDVGLSINDEFELAAHYFNTDQSYRFWRVVIVDPKNANLYVNVGVIVLGKAEALENPSNGFVYSLTDMSKIFETEYGHEYVDEYPTIAQLDISFDLLDGDTSEALQRVFRQVGSRLPIFITLDHDQSVFSEGNYSIYGKLPSRFSMNHIWFKYFNSGISIKEIS